MATGAYQRSGASTKTAAVNPPALRWGYASVTKTLVGVVMQMLMANQSLPQISWDDKLHQWLPLAVGTAYENASLLDVASHTACLIAEGAPMSQELLAESWQQGQLGGHPASRAVLVNNSLHHPPLSNCIPELNTQLTYVHHDGVLILALIEELISGLDFGTLAKTLIFDPLGMSSAEVVDANPAGGLWATLSDVGLYGQWLVDGYNNHPDAIAKTLLKHQDFVDLLSPIQKHGVEQAVGRTFNTYLVNGQRAAGHFGCLAASLEVLPHEDLVLVLAHSPEDASWSSCLATQHFLPLVAETQRKISEAFTSCERRPEQLCTATQVEGTLWSCKVNDTFALDSSTLDVPHKATSCREEEFSAALKESLATYLATAGDFPSKAFMVAESCQWGFEYYMLDPCASMGGGFRVCAENQADCGVYLIGNHSYSPEAFPCRCGALAVGSCSLAERACPVVPPQINTSCLVAGTTTQPGGVTTPQPDGVVTTQPGEGGTTQPGGVASDAPPLVGYLLYAVLGMLMVER